MSAGGRNSVTMVMLTGRRRRVVASDNGTAANAFQTEGVEANVHLPAKDFLNSVKIALAEIFGNPRRRKYGEPPGAELDAWLIGFQMMARGAHHFQRKRILVAEHMPESLDDSFRHRGTCAPSRDRDL